MHRRNFVTIALGWVVNPVLPRPSWLARDQTAEGLGMATDIGNADDAALPGLPKLRTRAANPHLIEDENGKPFFMAGVCPQSMVHWSTPEQMDAYFADRQKRHFNFAWVVINAFDAAGKMALTNPTDAHGDSMLRHGTSWDPKNLNPAYVAFVDAMVRSAARHGIYLFLDPFSCGYRPGPDGFDPAKHSPDGMHRWGEFWGKRYRNYTHVNFALGNDRLVWPQVDSVVSGLEQYMPDRLITIDWIGGPPNWSSDQTGPHKFYDAGHHWVNFNGWYEYHAPQWATWYHYHMVDPVMPTAIFETMYEDLKAGNPKHILTPPQTMREEVWATVLNGGSGFGILGAPDCTEDPMRWLGKTPGLDQAEYCTSFFTARRWYELIPDWSHTFLTSQAGTPGKDDFTYVSAAITADGSLGVCYYPGESGASVHLTVNLSKIGRGAGNSLARWYDPTNGNYATISTLAASGSHTFTTPHANSAGDADWVLVFERI
jgi:Protein of unknown function (DUF4038)/Putative collagen-binding domain of a collagenase